MRITREQAMVAVLETHARVKGLDRGDLKAKAWVDLLMAVDAAAREECAQALDRKPLFSSHRSFAEILRSIAAEIRGAK